MTPRIRNHRFYAHLPFLMLLLLGCLVRFYGIKDRAWDSDELGALFRAQEAADFATHVINGVSIDGHPALVQTFLWYNEQVWRSSPLQLKILWGILSIVSICLFYGFFWMRFGRKVALFTSSFLLLLWWPVSVSIWVRPYTIAFLWLGVLVFSSAKISRSHTLKHLWLLILGSSLALIAYSHYMAALTAVLFLLGELYLKKLQIKQFLLIAIIASVLFIPHTELFFKQLSEGGLSWLSKPDISFITQHVYFVFNESNLLIIAALFTVVLMIFWFRLKPINNQWLKHAGVNMGIWVGVFTISFVYSVLRKPVLQHNALYFSLPFLIGGFGIFIQRIPSLLIRFVQVVWIGLLIFSISAEKRYYGLGKMDRYAYPIQKLHGINTNETVLLDGPQDVLSFHEKSYPLNSKYFLNNQTNPMWFDSFYHKNVKRSDSFWVAFHAGSDMSLQTYFWSHFNFKPNTDRYKREFYTGGELFRAYIDSITFLEGLSNYSIELASDTFVIIDFKELSARLGTINSTDYLVVSILDPSNCNEVFHRYDLVTALLQEGFNKALHQIDYRFTPNNSFLNTQHINNGSIWLHHPIKLADIPHWDAQTKLRISYESRGSNKSSSNKDSKFTIAIRKVTGNPQLYTLRTLQSIEF